MSKKFILPLLCLLLFIALVTLSFFYYQEIQSKKGKKIIDPILTEVGKIMILPSETPKITTISNVEQALARDAQFFKDVKTGDKLIAYPYLLVLFDPKTKKIVNVQTFPPPPPTPSLPLRISFRYNGNEEERAQNLKKQLETVSAMYQIIEVVKSKAVYKDDVAYLINPARKQDISTFIQAIGNSPIINKLEPNETSTDADVIVAFRDVP